MKNAKKIKLISAIIFVPLLIIGSFLVLTTFDRSGHGTKVYTEVQEWGKFSGINIKTKTEEASEYSLSMSTPTTSSDYINHHIHEWLDGVEEDFFKQLNNYVGRTKDNLVAHLNIQLEIDEIKDHAYNLIFTTYTYLGEADGEHKIKVFTVDLEQEHIFTIDEIIPLENKKALKKFSKALQQVTHDDKQLSKVVDMEALDQAVTAYDELEWSVHQEILRLYFSEYMIALGSEGIITLDVPLDQFTQLIDEEIVDRFQLAVIEDRREAKQKKEKNKATKNDQGSNKSKKKKQKEKKKENKKTSNKQIKPIALTFDDGPSGTVTPEILHILEEFDAVATFFMLGSQVDYYPDLAAEIANRGHEVANHTQNHIDLTTVSKNIAKQEIDHSREKIEKATGQNVQLVRPPYGAYNDTTLNIIAENDESIILWSVDPSDWKNRKPKEISNRVLQTVKPGAIILLHDIHQTTAEALPKILEELTKDGYTFVTVSELIELENIEAMQVIRGQ